MAVSRTGATGRRAEPFGQRGLTLNSDPGEIVHLVCCRAPSWDVAFCGEPGRNVNLAAKMVCSICVEVAEQRRPGAVDADTLRCPDDGRPCPSEHEVDLRILREVSSL